MKHSGIYIVCHWLKPLPHNVKQWHKRIMHKLPIVDIVCKDQRGIYKSSTKTVIINHEVHDKIKIKILIPSNETHNLIF